MEKKKAFTLAETLTAIAIVGIISAITVPAVMQNTQKKEFVTALKKAYSTLSQVTNQIIAEEGSPKSTDKNSKDGWSYEVGNIYDLYKKHLNNVKECGAEQGCFAQKIKYLNGNTYNSWDGGSYRKLITADGMNLFFNSFKLSPQCSSRLRGSDNVCAEIWADVNGEKSPNSFGRDVFAFSIKENGLYPAGCDYDLCPSGDGLDCTCKVLRESSINY